MVTQPHKTETMASLYLPAPTRSGNKIGPIGGTNSGSNPPSSTAIVAKSSNAQTTTSTTSSSKKINRVPSYTDRCDAALRFSKLSPEERKLPANKKSMFVPRSTADFDDGVSLFELCLLYLVFFLKSCFLKHLSIIHACTNSYYFISVV